MKKIYVLGEPYFAAYSFEAYPHTLEEQSLALAQKIFDIREKALLETVIRRRYPHWQKEEITELARRAGQWIAEDLLACPLFAGPQRLRRCGEKLACSLEAAAGPFSIEGFCRFSFPHYRSYLQTSVAEAAAAWQGEREQAAYIGLLQNRLAQTPYRYREIHLYIGGDGLYHLYQESSHGRRPLEGGPVHGFEDLLLGSLLQLAPERLFLHVSDGQWQALTQALMEIFSDRLILCRHTP